jgi:hypothetical protein
MATNKKIFIQIAAYRDPQLITTLDDCFKNAKNPKNLRICVCWQHDDGEDLGIYKNHKQVKILDVPYLESKGVCWARHAIQQEYQGEGYTLQIDSHMRFTPNWDETLIKMIKDLQKKGYPKPLLTGYVPSFNPDNDPKERVQEPWRMVFDRFIPEGAVFFLPETIPNWKNESLPVPSRFYSAHFCFTLGKFAEEVQHNPEYYFHGEEISIAARAYTHGYDLFHPHRVVIWHEYTRRGRTKQWDDDKKWGERNNLCHSLNRKLFAMDGEKQEGHHSKYGFGKIRTLKDYEEYSGLLFSKRAVQQHTLDKKYPPNPSIKELGGKENWEKSFLKIFRHCIDVGYSSAPEKDYDFWAVAFHDENGTEMYRKDADKEEIERMFNDPDKYCKVWREFQTEKKPHHWVVWPHSISKGWCERLTGNI